MNSVIVSLYSSIAPTRLIVTSDYMMRMENGFYVFNQRHNTSTQDIEFFCYEARDTGSLLCFVGNRQEDISGCRMYKSSADSVHEIYESAEACLMLSIIDSDKERFRQLPNLM